MPCLLQGDRHQPGSLSIIQKPRQNGGAFLRPVAADNACAGASLFVTSLRPLGIDLAVHPCPRIYEGGAPRSESKILMIASGNHTTILWPSEAKVGGSPCANAAIANFPPSLRRSEATVAIRSPCFVPHRRGGHWPSAFGKGAGKSGSVNPLCFVFRVHCPSSSGTFFRRQTFPPPRSGCSEAGRL